MKYFPAYYVYRRINMPKRRFHTLNRPIGTRQVLFLAAEKGKAMNTSLYDYPLCGLVLEWPQDTDIPQNQIDIKKYLEGIKLKVLDELNVGNKSDEASKGTTEQQDLMAYLIAGLAGDVFQHLGKSDDDDEGTITLAKLCSYVDKRITESQLQGVKFGLPHDFDPATKIIRIDPERITTYIVGYISRFYDILLGPINADTLIDAARIITKLGSRKDIGIDTKLIQTLEDDFRRVSKYKYEHVITTWLDAHLKELQDEAMKHLEENKNDPALIDLIAILDRNLKELLEKDSTDLLNKEDTSNLKDVKVIDRVNNLPDIKYRDSYYLFSKIYAVANEPSETSDQLRRIINLYTVFHRKRMGQGRDVVSSKPAIGESPK